MKVTLCIPLYNEENVIRETEKTVRSYMDAIFGEDYEVIFINDGSTDKTEEILQTLCHGRVRAVSYTPNRGKGYAVRQGMLAGKGDVILFTDCDLAYGVEVIGETVALFEKRSDVSVVVGSRALHPEGYAGYTRFRRLVSKTYLSLLRIWGGLSLSDSQTGLKGFRNDAAKKIFSLCRVDRFAFDYEAIKIGEMLGFTFAELPVKIVKNYPSTVRFFRDAKRMMKDISKTKKRLRRLKKELISADISV